MYGYITIPGSGSQDIQFYLYADDGVYMKLDDTVVINDWQEQGPGMWNYVSTDQTLTGGQTYYIDMWWYENGGGAAVKLYWDQTGSVAIVPASTYSLTEPTPTSAATSTQTSLSTTTSTITDANISGDYNTVNLSQKSDNNVLLFGVNSDHNDLTVSQGDNVNDTGGHRAIVDVTGNYNSTTLTQYDTGFGSGQFADINISGNDNTITSTQRETDKMLFIDVNGSDNTITTDQKDSGQHFLDITVGSNQTVSVTQQGTGDHAATVDMGGYSAGLSLDQNSSTDQNYVLEQTCANVSGCGTPPVTQN